MADATEKTTEKMPTPAKPREPRNLVIATKMADQSVTRLADMMFSTSWSPTEELPTGTALIVPSSEKPIVIGIAGLHANERDAGEDEYHTDPCVPVENLVPVWMATYSCAIRATMDRLLDPSPVPMEQLRDILPDIDTAAEASERIRSAYVECWAVLLTFGHLSRYVAAPNAARTMLDRCALLSTRPDYVIQARDWYDADGILHDKSMADVGTAFDRALDRMGFDRIAQERAFSTN